MYSDRPFLEAIREQPDDDLNRLAWADWLEEKGDDDRAAFVRAQLAAAHLDETDLAIDALEDRADDLLALHDRDWAGRVGELALAWGWARGCVESATFTAHTLIEHGDELFETMPIRHVRILADDDDLPRIAEGAWLRHVEHLEMSTGALVRSLPDAPYLRDRPLQTLLASPHLGRLTSLDLRGQGVEGPLLDTLIDTGVLGRLRRLDLSGNLHFGDRATRRLADAKAPALEWLGLEKMNRTALGLQLMLSSSTFPALRTLQADMGLLFSQGGFNSGRLDRELLQSSLAGQLTSLTLRDFPLSVQGLETLVLSPLAARLTELCLENVSLKGEAEAGVLATAENLAGLRRLDLRRNFLHDKGARVLASSPYLTSLLHLDLSWNSIGGPGIRALLDSPILDRLRSFDLSLDYVGVANVTALSKSQRPRLLRELRLRAANFDPECAAILARSPAFSRLRDLDLGSNQLGDDGIAAIANSPHLTRLRSLDLEGTGADTNGVQALLDTSCLPSLRRLSLRSNPRLSPGERDRLAVRFGASTRF